MKDVRNWKEVTQALEVYIYTRIHVHVQCVYMMGHMHVHVVPSKPLTQVFDRRGKFIHKSHSESAFSVVYC